MKDSRMSRVFSKVIFALPILILFLAGCKKSVEESREEARKYFEQAVDYYNREYFSNAKELFNDVIEIEDDLKLKENFGEANLYLGLIFFREEDYESALKHNQHAKEFFKLKLKRREEGIAENNIGNTYSACGEFSKAEEHYRKAMLICQLAADKEGEADALINVAQVYFELGDFRNAFQYYSKAFDEYDLIGIQEGKVNASIKMGESQLRFGAYSDAIRSFEFALEFAVSNGIAKYYPDILNLIALTYFKLGDYDRTAQNLEQALQIIEKSETESELNWAVKNNLADVYYQTYQHSKAIENYKAAINILSDYGEELSAALLKLKLGINYLDAIDGGDNAYLENAVDLFESLSDYFNGLEYPPGKVNALAGLAKCYLLKRDLEKAISVCEEIKELLADIPIIIKNKLTERLCLQPDIFRSMNVTEILLLDNRIEEAITFDLLIKENLARYFIASDQKNDRKISNNLILAEIEFLKFEITNEKSKEAGTSNSTKLAYLKNKLEEKQSKIDNQKTSAEELNFILDLNEIKKRLKPNQALAVYFSVQEKINVVVVTKQKHQSILLPVSEEALSGQVKNLINFFNKSDFTSAREILKGMNASLFKPIEYLVKDNSSLLIYVAEDLGTLNYIPFHALIDENGKYLSEKYSVEYFGGFKNEKQSESYSKNIFISLADSRIKTKENEKAIEFWNQKVELKNKIIMSRPQNLILMSPVHIRLAEPFASYLSLSTDSIRSKELDASASEFSKVNCKNLFILNYFDDYAGSSFISSKAFGNSSALYLNRLFRDDNHKEKLAVLILNQFIKDKEFSIQDFYKQNLNSTAMNWASLFAYIKL